MKRSTFATLILAAIFAMPAIEIACAQSVEYAEKTAQTTTAPQFNGKWFCTQYVNDMLQYGDSTHYVVYSNYSEGLEYEAIRITADTYDRIRRSYESGEELYGFFQAAQTNGVIEYTISE